MSSARRILCLCVGSKILSSLLTGIIPLALNGKVEKSVLQAIDHVFEVSLLVSTVLLSSYFACFSHMSRRVVIFSSFLCCVTTCFLSCGIIPEGILMYILMLGITASLFLMSLFASAISLENNVAVSRFKLIATVITQLYHVLVLYFEIFGNPVVLCFISILGFVVFIFGAFGTNSVTAKKNHDDVDISKTIGLHTAGTLLFFMCVGLNGEQLLDAKLKVSLKNVMWEEGRKAPIAMHHLITAGARLVAFSSDTRDPFKSICIWAVCQMVIS